MPRRRATTSTHESSLRHTLLDPASYDHPVDAVVLAETHISWVFLTGRYAYKVKKPIKLPFLDFSTLKRRKHFCEEELALNRRLAPHLYLGVVPIGGTPAQPRVGRTPAFEFAVKMRQFAPDARLDRCLASGSLDATTLLAFADDLERFHASLPPLYSDPLARAPRAAAIDNFAALAPHVAANCRSEVAALKRWTEQEGAALDGVLRRRVAQGAERECHGDMHLENLLLERGKVVAYDALEFDRSLRTIDVVSEASFLAMDLLAHGRADLGFTFLNRYFEAGGDYGGIEVLRFYLVYRALVRAKVLALKATQNRARAKPSANLLRTYLAVATELARPRRPLLLITHGLSGSGKTSVTSELVGRLRALRVRSDVERKRLRGIAAASRTGAAVGAGLYVPAHSRATYAALGDVADRALRRGFDIIVDAAFLRRRERALFQQIAAANGARFAILECTASKRELRRRIEARAALGRDASEANLAVLDRQLIERDALAPWERRACVSVDTERGVRYDRLARALERR
jgi:aminoglycoside phosphotransferase family enzyme/predicted kinase